MDSYEAEELGKYTSLSSLAVCAFLLGLASLVALLAPLMVVIPIAGVFVALFALLRIGRSEGALTGRPLAVAGLALAAACGIAAPLRVQVRDSLYSAQADEAGRRWLEAVATNDIATAFEQTTGNAKGNLMGPPSRSGEPHKYDATTSQVNLGNDPLVAKLREESTHGAVKLATKSLTVDASGAVPRAGVTYQTVEPDDSLTMALTLLRSTSGNGWLVDSWRLEGETAHNHDHSHSD